MASPKLPLLRRISQIFFLLLFLALLSSIALRPPAGATGGLLSRAPVHLFFEWDPLVAIANALATHSLYRGLLWCLIVLVPTLFLGRIFCGWICPVGTLQQFIGHLPSDAKRGKQRIASNRYKRWHTFKYAILIAGLIAALFQSAVIGWLDPLSLMARSLSLSLLPALNFAARTVLGPLEHSGIPAVRAAGEGIHTILEALMLDFRQAHFSQALFLGVLIIGILAASLYITRLWCRLLCPLGALLGAVSRWSILGLDKDAAGCDNCNRCLLHCQGGDDPVGSLPWRKAECLMCMNCVESCPQHALRFRFFRKGSEIISPDLGRRRALSGLAMGAAIVPLMRVNTGLDKSRHERLLRPPGALAEPDFLSRCIRCGECMRVCPNNALQPTLLQAGVEGMWTPTLVPRVGYCEPSCVLCTEACPTGAIWQITVEEKGWIGDVASPDSTVHSNSAERRVRLGTAFYDRGHCLPWAMATECIVCEEWCPVSPKAIYLEEAPVMDAEGNSKSVKQPHIDPQRCVGCGVCEYACPLQDHPAVYVTSIGESRSRSSQFLLTRG